MRRREFIALLGGAASDMANCGAGAACLLPVIWYFNSGKSSAQTNNLAAFRKGLKEAGFAEGENVVIQFRWGENQFNRLPSLASEVIASRPTIIVSNTLAALQTKTATTTIPIVFTTGSDPVRGRYHYQPQPTRR